MTQLRYRWAINQGLAEAMRADSSVLLFGQDIGQFGGDFGVTRGLLEEFGPDRVVDAPVSETAIVGAGVGAALAGLRPVVEMSFADFLLIAGDETFLKAAKWRYIHGDDFTVPLVIRAATGSVGGAGSEHSGSYEAMVQHFPGIRAVAPATPRDAKGMMRSAIACDDPVIFFEHKALYNTKGEVGEEPEPLEGAVVRRAGSDITVVAHGGMLPRALQAADSLAEEGVDVEVIDLRSIVPLDHETVLASVARTNRLVTAEEGLRTGGIGAEVAARVQAEGLHLLDAPILRVGARTASVPYSPILEAAVLPSAETIAEAIRKLG